MVEPFMGDMIFDRCILLAELSGRLGLAKRAARVAWSTSLARVRQRCLWLAIRSGTSSAAFCIPSCNSSTWKSSSNKKQNKPCLLYTSDAADE